MCSVAVDVLTLRCPPLALPSQGLERQSAAEPARELRDTHSGPESVSAACISMEHEGLGEVCILCMAYVDVRACMNLNSRDE